MSAWRVAGRVGGVLAIVIASAVTVLMLCLDTAPARRLVARQVNGALERTVQGRIRIDAIRVLAPFGVSEADATILDPIGRPVLTVRGARVRLAIAAAVRSAIFGRGGPLMLTLSVASVADADVRLDSDSKGHLELADAFAPRPAPGSRASSGRAIHLSVPRIAIEHTHAHGRIAGAPVLDADVDGLRGALDYTPEVFALEVSDAAMVARGLANGADVRAALRGHLGIPSGPGAKVLARLAWHGSVGDVPHSGRAAIENDRVDAVLDAPDVRPEAVRAFWPAFPVDRPGALHLEASGTLPRLVVDLRVALGDARLHAALSASVGGALGDAVGGHVEADVPDLEVPRVRGAVRRHTRVVAEGALDLGTMTLAARADVTAAGLVQGTTRIDAALLSARALGSVADPRLEVTLRARDVRVAGLALTSVDASASGGATSAHVVASARGPAVPSVDASADVAIVPDLSLGALRAVIARGGERAVVSADSVALGDTIRIDGGRVDGLGAPATVAMVLTEGTLRVRASTRGVDLACLGRLAHLERTLKAGVLAVDADLSLRRDGGAGTATVDLTHAAMGAVSDVSAHLEAKANGRAIAGKVHAQAADIGSVDVSTPGLDLDGGGPLSAAAWRKVRGHVDFSASADLAKLTARVKEERWPLRGARGKALEGIGVKVQGRLEGPAGALDLAVRLRDERGELVESQVTSPRVPWWDLFRVPTSLANDLRSMPFDLHVVLPERGLGSMPGLSGQTAVAGKVRAELRATGPILAPRVDFTATLRDSVFAGQGSAPPVDVDVSARYDGASGTATLKAHSSDSTILDAEARVDGFDPRALSQPGGASSLPWRASARAHFAGFPLEAIAFLDDKQVSGQLSGDASISGLNESARADATLAIDSLRVGSVGYRSARLQVKADGNVVDGSVRIEQTDGFAEARTRAPASWGSALVPSVHPSSPLVVSLAAKNFRIAGLLPFVDGTIDELDGRVNSDARLEFDPVARATRLAGSLTLDRGVFEASAGGGEFHDVAAAVRFSPDGVVTLEKLSARGVTGRLDAAATARLDGVRLQAIRGVVVIPENAAIPMNAGGIEVGNMDGRFDVSAMASPDERALDVTVQVPHMRVVLPQGMSTSVQALGPMDKVEIGARRGDPATFTPLPGPRRKSDGSSTPTRTAVAVHLADVEVVRGTDLKVDLDGQVNSNAGPGTNVTGQIHLKRGGAVTVQGKTFRIESGTVTLVGPDPSNPEVVVKAGWKAPDGTVVYATFTGPLKTGKVTLSSEPTMSQQEIVELLLFGTTQGQPAQTFAGTSQSTAVGTVGGQAVQPLNHALNQVGLGAVQANIDTASAANPRPEVKVQIARDISLQVAVVLGQVPPGVNPDHTLVTVDWRFLSRWSLASTVGDQGTTIFDLLWQRRY